MDNIPIINNIPIISMMIKATTSNVDSLFFIGSMV